VSDLPIDFLAGAKYASRPLIYTVTGKLQIERGCQTYIPYFDVLPFVSGETAGGKLESGPSGILFSGSFPSANGILLFRGSGSNGTVKSVKAGWSSLY
jgi:hypothetical protein